MCTNDLAYVGASSANIEPRQEPSGGNPARESADLLAPDCRSRRAGSCSECESCDATCRPAVVWFTPGDDARRPAARLSRLPASSARRLAARIVGALKLAHHGSRTHPHRGRSRLTHCDHTGDGRRRRFTPGGSRPVDRHHVRHHGRRQRSRPGCQPDRLQPAALRLRLRRGPRNDRPPTRCGHQSGA